MTTQTFRGLSAIYYGYIDPHYNKLKSRNRCTFPETTVKKITRTRTQTQEHGHKAKPIKSTYADVKANDWLKYLDRSYFSKPHMNLLKEHVYALCEAV